MSYCDYISQPGCDELHIHYHNLRYGFPLDDDRELFARLVMEINQAGLSWITILKKERYFRLAYDDFRPEVVAAYGHRDVERLMSDPGIIRNRLKIGAAIHNAGVVLSFQEEFGSLRAWLDAHHPLDLKDWVKLFRKHFRFTGGEIVNEFLMSTGYLPGAHHPHCPIYTKVLESGPAWSQTAPG